MLAAVYFKDDGKFDTINCKKIKRMDEKTGLDLEIEEKVFVPYKTRTIDDAGRERDVDVDYEGVTQENQVNSTISSSSSSVSQPPINPTSTSIQQQPPINQTSTIMQQQPPINPTNTPVQQQPLINLTSTPVQQQPPINPTCTPVQQQPPTNLTSTIMQQQPPINPTSTPVQQQTPLNPASTPVQQQTPCNPTSTPVQQTAINLTSTPDQQQTPIIQRQYSPNSFFQPSATNVYLDQEHNGTLINMDSGNFFSASSTISQGLNTIYGGTTHCNQCETYKAKILRLTEQNNQLELDIESLGGLTRNQNTSLLQDLKQIINKYSTGTPISTSYIDHRPQHTVDCRSNQAVDSVSVYSRPMSNQAVNSRSEQEAVNSRPEQETVDSRLDMEQDLDMSSSTLASLSSSSAKYKSNTSRANIDAIETVENYQSFFLSGSNKKLKEQMSNNAKIGAGIALAIISLIVTLLCLCDNFRVMRIQMRDRHKKLAILQRVKEEKEAIRKKRENGGVTLDETLSDEEILDDHGEDLKGNEKNADYVIGNEENADYVIGNEENADYAQGYEQNADFAQGYEENAYYAQGYGPEGYEDYAQGYRDDVQGYKDYAQGYGDYPGEYADYGQGNEDYAQEYADYHDDYADHAQEYADYGQGNEDYGQEYADYPEEYANYAQGYEDYPQGYTENPRT